MAIGSPIFNLPAVENACDKVGRVADVPPVTSIVVFQNDVSSVSLPLVVAIFAMITNLGNVIISVGIEFRFQLMSITVYIEIGEQWPVSTTFHSAKSRLQPSVPHVAVLFTDEITLRWERFSLLNP